MHTPINKVWNTIRKIKGRDTAEKYKHLKMGNHIYTDKKEISNIIGQTISKNSSKDNLSHKFIAYKNTQEKTFLDFTSENNEYYNEPFTLDELLQSLNNSHDTAVVPNQIHYQILKHLPHKSKECLLQIFNKNWESGHFPLSWSQAIVIPIPKPGKDNTHPNSFNQLYL